MSTTAAGRRRDVTAAISGPLTDSIKARLRGNRDHAGRGLSDRHRHGQKYGKLNRGGARALFDIRLSEAASLLLNFHYVYDHSVPSSPSTPNVEALIPPEPFPTAGLLDSPPGGTWVSVGGLPLYKDENGDGTVATLNVRFDGLTLTSISAFDDFSEHSLDNYDGYPAADNNWTKNFQQQQFSEELRLASAHRRPRGLDRRAPSTRRTGTTAATRSTGHSSMDLRTTSRRVGKAITAANFIQRQ